MGDIAGFKGAVTSRSKPLLVTLLFFSLAVFFSYPNTSYRSFFRQAITILNITTYSDPYFQIRNAFYFFSLAAGLLLIAAYLRQAKNGEKASGLAAINLAWLAFVLEASVSLGFQWTPLDVWIVLNSTVFAAFVATIVLLASSVFLLMPYKWARLFGYFVSWVSLISCLLMFALMLKYFVLYQAPFPTLMVIMSATTAESTYYFHKYGLASLRSENITKKLTSHARKLKKLFASNKVLSVVLVSVLLLESAAFAQPGNYWESKYAATNSFSLGVAFCGNTTDQAVKLIDRVKNFTNLLVVQSLPISQNETALNEICDYAVNARLKVAVYFSLFNQYWQVGWLDLAKDRWGDKFIGVYLYDEPGGLNLDARQYLGTFGNRSISSYAEATDNYLSAFRLLRGRADMRMLKMRGIRAVTSDYALYWFDYKAGYDVVFAQFAWNYSRQLNVALCRGAAAIQNKDWGVMITWMYNHSPYIESGKELYNDAVFAYDNGAKYILVFNYPYSPDSNYGILQEEHLEALSKFWDYAKNNSQPKHIQNCAVAYVLPKDYGYGFRGPNDKIWGLWEADAQTTQMCVNLNNALAQYGQQLDIIYEDGLNLNSAYAPTYSKLIFWNETK